MAWKRNEKHEFTAKQKERMVFLHRTLHRTITQIAEVAGCSTTAVSGIMKKHCPGYVGKRSKANGKPQVSMTTAGIQVEVHQAPKPAKQLAPEVEAYVKEAAAQAEREIEEYLLWKAESAARMIGGTSFLNYYKKASA